MLASYPSDFPPVVLLNNIGAVAWRNSSEINGLSVSAAKNGGNPSGELAVCPPLPLGERPIAVKNVSCAKIRQLAAKEGRPAVWILVRLLGQYAEAEGLNLPPYPWDVDDVAPSVDRRTKKP